MIIIVSYVFTQEEDMKNIWDTAINDMCTTQNK